MLTRIGHNKSLDFYSLGVLLFEMLTGLPPFYSQDRQEMYQAILNDEIYFPPNLSEHAVDLLHKLLQKDPCQRIGYKFGAAEIRSHPFFKEINWQDLYDKKVKVPYKLNMRGTHFDTEFINENINWSQDETALCEKQRSQSLIYDSYKTRLSFDNNDDTVVNEFVKINDKKIENFKSIIIPNSDCFELEKPAISPIKLNNKQLLGKIDIFAEYAYSKDFQFQGTNFTSLNSSKKCLIDKDLKCKNTMKIMCSSGDCGEPEIIVFESESEDNLPNSENTKTSNNGHHKILTEPMSPVHPQFVKLNFETKESIHNRCTSLKNIETLVIGIHSTKNIHESKPMIFPKKATKQKFKIVNAKIHKSKKQAQDENTRLIKQAKSKICDTLLKLNDERIGVISERKRIMQKKIIHNIKPKIDTKRNSRKNINLGDGMKTKQRNYKEICTGLPPEMRNTDHFIETSKEESQFFNIKSPPSTQNTSSLERMSSNIDISLKKAVCINQSRTSSLMKTLKKLTNKQASLSKQRNSSNRRMENPHKNLNITITQIAKENDRNAANKILGTLNSNNNENIRNNAVNITKTTEKINVIKSHKCNTNTVIEKSKKSTSLSKKPQSQQNTLKVKSKNNSPIMRKTINKSKDAYLDRYLSKPQNGNNMLNSIKSPKININVIPTNNKSVPKKGTIQILKNTEISILKSGIQKNP